MTGGGARFDLQEGQLHEYEHGTIPIPASFVYVLSEIYDVPIQSFLPDDE